MKIHCILMKNFSKVISNEEQKSDISVPPKFLEDYRISLFVPEVRSKSFQKIETVAG